MRPKAIWQWAVCAPIGFAILVGLGLGIVEQGIAQAEGSKKEVAENDHRVREHARRMIDEGERTFRFDTFGDEAFWGDLLGLHKGYESQDATVRAAILAQFPRMSVAFVRAKDNTNVQSSGFNVAVDVPIFDRNQGVIATERATRQRLLDEYNQRVFEARSDIAVAIADIRALNRQVAAAQEALPVLERLVDSAEKAREQGNVDVLSYYTARNNLLQKKIQLIKLQEQLLEANTALEIASGRYLPMNRALQPR